MITAEGSVTTFRQRALEEIKKVNWDPAWGEERISNMIATRPDWCISRQRIWGVPSPSSSATNAASPSTNPPSTRASSTSSRTRAPTPGTRTTPQRSCPPAPPAQPAAPHRVPQRDGHPRRLVRVRRKLARRPRPRTRTPLPPPTSTPKAATSIAAGSTLRCSPPSASRNHAPYKMVATSGWTLDEQGRAFSKSLGNGVDPVDIAKRLGGEIIRLWVASVDFREDVAASENLMQRVSENYRKLRNTFRFLLGNLHDFNPATDAVPFAEPAASRPVHPRPHRRARRQNPHRLRRLRIPPRLPRAQRVREHRPQRALPRRAQRPPLHLRTQPPRPPQRTNRPLAHRRSPHPPHRPHPQLHRRRSLGAPP